MTRVMRPGSAAVACLAAVLLAAACGSGPQASPGTSGSTPKTGSAALEKTHIVFGASPVADDAAIFLAIKDGYFRQQGLTVTPELAVQSTQQVPDLLHGTLDIIGGNYVSFFEGDAQQTFDLKVLAATSSCVPKSFEILTLPRSGIKGAAGLAGKTIAVNLTHSIQTLTTNRLLQADGVNPGSVHYVVIPFTEMAAALKAGRVDAISVVEPFVTAAEHSVGAVPAMSQCQGPTASLPLAGYFTTQSWLQRYPNTARAFQRAIEKAQQLANTDHQAVVQILPTYTKLTPQTAALITLDTYPDTLNAAQLQRVADLMYSGGLLKSPLNVSTLLFH